MGAGSRVGHFKATGKVADTKLAKELQAEAAAATGSKKAAPAAKTPQAPATQSPKPVVSGNKTK